MKNIQNYQIIPSQNLRKKIHQIHIPISHKTNKMKKVNLLMKKKILLKNTLRIFDEDINNFSNPSVIDNHGYESSIIQSSTM